jgi:hypothetical protein
MKIYLQVMLGLVMVSEALGGYTYPGAAEYTAGAEENEAIIVVDFDAGNFFVFKYKWDGLATGWDALAAIDAAGALDVNAKWYPEFNSHFVSDFVYPLGQKYDYGQAITGWGYWGSADGEGWILNAGVDNRQLESGSWDSWVWSNYDFSVSWDPLRSPGEVPEPATIVLLGSGALYLFKLNAANIKKFKIQKSKCKIVEPPLAGK